MIQGFVLAWLLACSAVLAADAAALPAKAIAQARQAATSSKAAALDIGEVEAMAAVNSASIFRRSGRSRSTRD